MSWGQNFDIKIISDADISVFLILERIKKQMFF